MYDPKPVTLAIPCFNAARFIGATLDSVNLLDPAPDEIIVVDDGSTDNSGNIISRYPDVRWIIHEKNEGIAAARNTALDAASNGIIVFIDADVIAPPELIYDLTRHYCDDKIAGVGGRALEANSKSNYDRWRGETLFQGWGDHFLPDTPFLFGLCSSYRKEILERIGGFNNRYKVSGEDMDISFRLRKAGYRLVYEPAAVVDHMRSDTKETLEKMTYRHCFWGFVAQRLNRCYDNKVSIPESMKMLFQQVLWDGIAKGNLSFAGLTIHMHWIILRAWFDSGRYVRGNTSLDTGADRILVWEGHGESGSDNQQQ